MVGLQEELDWLCYKLYGIDPEAEIRDPDNDTINPLVPGLRPFEVTLAREDAERRAALARGEEPDEQPTAWFSRHGWEPVLDPSAPLPGHAAGLPGQDGGLPGHGSGLPGHGSGLPGHGSGLPGHGSGLPGQTRTSAHTLPALSAADLAVLEGRLARTAESRDLSLLEQPTYKRRWYKPDHEKEEREALTLWLQDRIEDLAKTRKEPFTIGQIAAALRSDPAALAVGELITGRADFDLDALVGEQIRDQAVPNQKHHVFKPEGLRKRAQWEETWRLQHLEDAGQKVTPPVPPKYDTKDYLRSESWSLRGKLDVPKERFIAFTEAPAEVSEEALYGWAGWTHRERARALLGLDEKAESAGVPVQDRYGLLYGVWFLLRELFGLAIAQLTPAAFKAARG